MSFQHPVEDPSMECYLFRAPHVHQGAANTSTTHDSNRLHGRGLTHQVPLQCKGLHANALVFRISAGTGASIDN